MFGRNFNKTIHQWAISARERYAEELCRRVEILEVEAKQMQYEIAEIFEDIDDHAAELKTVIQKKN